MKPETNVVILDIRPVGSKREKALKMKPTVLVKESSYLPQQPITFHPSLLSSCINKLIGWECVWLSSSHYVCFPFTKPRAVCVCVHVCTSHLSDAHTKQTARGWWGATCWIGQRLKCRSVGYWKRIVDSTIELKQEMFGKVDRFWMYWFWNQ